MQQQFESFLHAEESGMDLINVNLMILRQRLIKGSYWEIDQAASQQGISCKVSYKDFLP
jgi:hypothetical protein